jgi:hypothetical protein
MNPPFPFKKALLYLSEQSFGLHNYTRFIHLKNKTLMSRLQKQLLKQKIANISDSHPKISESLNKPNFEPESWEPYFDSRQVIEGGFQVYRAGTSGPICVFLHGAGHSALSWALVAVKFYFFPIRTNTEEF